MRTYLQAALKALEYEQVGTIWTSKSQFIAIALPPNLDWATLKVLGCEEELLLGTLTVLALKRLGEDILDNGFEPSSRLQAEAVYAAHRNALRLAEIIPSNISR